MKNFSEKLKDIFYASIDYVIMLGIIATVVLIIGWRLDILFQKDVLASISEEDMKIIKEIDDKKDLQAKVDAELDKKENPEKSSDVQDLEMDDPEVLDELKENVKIIEIRIPEGSFPAQIGSILQSSGLISSSTDFIKKSVDLNLDTKLKSGTFLIPENSSLEKIVNIISRQRT